MNNRQELIEYLDTIGKQENESWLDLALRFDIRPDITNNSKRSKACQDIWRTYKGVKKSVHTGYVPMVESKVLDMSSSFRENLDKGNAEASAIVEIEPKTPEDIMKAVKLDSKLWKLTSYRVSHANSKWSVSASVRKADSTINFQDSFVDFLKDFKPQAPIERYESSSEEKACLILNKQDAHMNKFDTTGMSGVQERFNEIRDKTFKMIEKASAINDLQHIVYIIGSDQFNSEWTGFTTKGTPQENALPYEQSFKMICQHEVEVINKMLEEGHNVTVIYLPGNHDRFVSWHMVSWLQAFYRDQKNLQIDASVEFSKYIKYGNTAMMFNHGDVMTPTKLASMFPMEFRGLWSECEYQYIFTGDKHNELSKDFNGIKFYQIPALSKSKSMWDRQ